MPIPALVIPAAIGAAQAVTGLLKGGKGKREAARLAASRPKLGDSEFVADQLSLAESELSTGISGAAENAYEQGLSRDLSTSLDAILKGGGDQNNVAELFDRSAVGRQRLTLMRENMRLNQINNLSRAQQMAEQERLQQFEFNEYRPWADAAQSNAAARQGAENQLWGGLQTVAGAATGFLQGQQQQNNFDKYLSVLGGNGGGGGSTFNPQSPQRTSMTGYNSPTAPANPVFGRGVFNNNIDESLFDYPGSFE